MEVPLSADKEARIQQMAVRSGKNPVQVVEEAIDRMLDYDERFMAAVEVGRDSARRQDNLHRYRGATSISPTGGA